MSRRYLQSEASRYFANDYIQPADILTDNRYRSDIYPDQDLPLDEFDRQLLAERSDERAWQDNRILGIPMLPPRLPCTPLNNQPKSLRDDLLDVRMLAASSSSPMYSASSPIIASLQNRQSASQRSIRSCQDGMQVSENEPTKFTPSFSARTSTKAMPTKLPYEPPRIQGIQLITTRQLPDDMRSIFKFPLFNAVQSKCFSPAYEGEDNIVLSAPTGSGKTVVLELAICRLLKKNMNEDFKVVYQAPTKSLCSERFRDWNAKFKSLGLECAELTGDSEFVSLMNVQRAHIIIATPEKWDSATRRWKDNAKLMRMIKLFLIDEVHILKESRGATLEAITSRMKSVGAGVRFIALSATVPNSEDIATWLGLNSLQQGQPAIREVFGEEFRPVVLDKHVLGFQSPPNDFILDSILVKEIPGVIAQYSKRKPVMIFCATKRAAATQASKLAELWTTTTPQERLWRGPRQQLKTTNEELKKVITAGVAFHHSGLDTADRLMVEHSFLNGDINVICSTSTLAVGVNLPCYLVILKGTVSHSTNGLQEYSSLEVMQMLGRAGRPQFETSACAVILTNKEKAHRYEKMISGHELLESCLHLNLIEHLNAEIGIGTVYDLNSAKNWLMGTFLSVRMQRNPRHYQLAQTTSLQSIDALLEGLCEREIGLLTEAKLIETTRAGFRSTEFGNIMARYYVKHETMKTFTALPSRAKMSEILHVLTCASEFKELRWCAGEKAFFKQINKTNDVRYPVKVDIALPAHKASLVVQIHLGGIILDKESNRKHSAQLKQDTLMVLAHCNRLIRCIIDMQVFLEDAISTRNALELARSLAAGVWDNTPMQLKQISGIGEVTVRKLASAGINSIDVLLTTEPHRIDLVMGKSQPYGNDLLKKATHVPNLRLNIKEVGKQQGSGRGVRVDVRCEIGCLNGNLPTYFNRKQVYVILLCETSYGKVADFRRFSIKRLINGENILLNVLLDRPATHLRCHVMCDEVAGTHRHAELKLAIPTAWFPEKHVPDVQFHELVDTDFATINNGGDEFDDPNLDDNDFLAAEARAGSLDDTEIVTENIETLPTQCTKRKTDQQTLYEGALTDWRKPLQLDNGNWTCQHVCNDEGKMCNHQCCRDGVKKPRKRPKVIIQADEKRPLPSKRRLLEWHETKGRGNSSGNKSISEIFNNVSKLTQEYTEENHKNISSLLGLQTISSHASTLLPIRAKEYGEDFVGTKAKANEVQRLEKLEDSIDLDIYDIGDLDPAECDWNVNFTTTDHVSSFHDQYDLINKERVFLPKDGSCVDTSEDIKLGNVANTVNRDDCNKFGSSPKKLFFSQPSSSPQKLHSSTKFLQDKDHDEVWKNSLDNLSNLYHADLSAFGSSRQSGTESASKLSSKKYLDADKGEELEYERSLGSLMTLQTTTTTTTTTETEEERQKRMHQEDQKRKWESLDPVLFEEFGAYVELI